MEKLSNDQLKGYAEKDGYEPMRQLAAELLELREQTRWIPVGERLPKNEVTVITWNKEINDEPTVGFYTEGDESVGMYPGWADENGDYIDDRSAWPTHWMPLPLPPSSEVG